MRLPAGAYPFHPENADAPLAASEQVPPRAIWSRDGRRCRNSPFTSVHATDRCARNPAGHSRSSRSHDHARCRRSVGGSFLGSRTRTIDPSATFILQIAPPESRRAIPIQVCLSLALTKQPPGRQSARRRAPARPGHDAKLPSTTPMAPLRGNHAALNDQPPASRSPRYSAMVRSRPVPQHIMCMSNKAA